MPCTDYMTDAINYLEDIADQTWERIVGHQSRKEFARLAFDAGQSIDDAWSEALAHAEGL